MVNQNSIWLRSDVNHELGGCCLTTDTPILYVYVFFAFLRICRVQKRYTILTLFDWTHFRLYEKTFFVKHQPEV